MTTTLQDRPIRTGAVNGLRLVLGLVVLTLGVAVLLRTDATLLVVALLFGTQLLVFGLIRTVLAAQSLPRGGRRALGVTLGVLTASAGVVCLLQPGTSLLLLIWTVAIGWLSDALSEFAAAATAGNGPAARAGHVLFGVAGVLGALAVVTFPGASLVLFAQIGGVVLVVFAGLTVASALRSR